MDLDAIRELIVLMRENKIARIDWRSEDGQHIKLVAEDTAPRYIAAAPAPQLQAQEYAPAPAPSAAGAAPAPAAPPAETIGRSIPSPIVGVFYASPSPDKAAFVDIGASVTPETVVCIIEAMKVMNEIKAEVSGRIKRMLVENGQAVEYGQPLFELE